MEPVSSDVVKVEDRTISDESASDEEIDEVEECTSMVAEDDGFEDVAETPLVL